MISKASDKSEVGSVTQSAEKQPGIRLLLYHILVFGYCHFVTPNLMFLYWWQRVSIKALLSIYYKWWGSHIGWIFIVISLQFFLFSACVLSFCVFIRTHFGQSLIACHKLGSGAHLCFKTLRWHYIHLLKKFGIDTHKLVNFTWKHGGS